MRSHSSPRTWYSWDVTGGYLDFAESPEVVSDLRQQDAKRGERRLGLEVGITVLFPLSAVAATGRRPDLHRRPGIQGTP